jgi:hypothetical protein
MRSYGGDLAVRAGGLLSFIGGGLILRALGLIDVLTDTPLRNPPVEILVGIAMLLGATGVFWTIWRD